jgi:hypothetical protein
MSHAIRALMTGLIDYAGLFPPAGLPMWEAVGNYARYRQPGCAGVSPANAGRRPAHPGEMLGRFVVPARRLAEFGAAFDETPEKHQEGKWGLSVLLSRETTEEDLAIAQEFAVGQPAIEIGAFETPAESIETIDRLRALVPIEQEIYFELPIQAPNLDPLLAAIARNGACAKVRTGGLEKKSFPSPDALLTFLTACADARAPWKATAGLHHALRGNAALTYKPASPCAKMHGFLNVFLAATAFWTGRPRSETLALLSGEGRGDLKVEDDAITWHGVRLTASEIAEARRSFCRSFGSCSFTEPVEEIRDIDIPF